MTGPALTAGETGSPGTPGGREPRCDLPASRPPAPAESADWKKGKK